MAGLPISSHLVAHPHAGLVQLDGARQIDRRRHQHQIAGHALDGLLQFVPLQVAVAHGRQDPPEVGKLLERLLDGADRIRTRIDQRGRVVAIGRDHAGAVRHLAVRERGTVLDHQHALAA